MHRYAKILFEFDETPPILNEIFSLILALWGDLPEKSENLYVEHRHRRQRISRWLEESIAESVKMKILASKSKSEEIFYYLAGNQLNNGILAAIANREFRLALLIGQCRQVQCRPLIMNQLVEWKQLGADKFIDEWKLKSYLLLAGLTSWETSSGEIVNASEGFDWLQVFALYCW